MSPDPSAPPIWLIFVLFPVFFATIWLGVTGLLSVIGGWRDIAAVYPGTGSETVAHRFSFASGSLGRGPLPVSYKSCLNVGVADWGIALSVLLPFRFLHAPIAIPWSAVERCEDSSFGWWRGVAIWLESGQRIVLRGHASSAVKEAWTGVQNSAGRIVPSSV
jgi:hypothetical protein